MGSGIKGILWGSCAIHLVTDFLRPPLVQWLFTTHLPRWMAPNSISGWMEERNPTAGHPTISLDFHYLHFGKFIRPCGCGLASIVVGGRGCWLGESTTTRKA